MVTMPMWFLSWGVQNSAFYNFLAF
jgi:hypothetical protein